VARFRIFFRQSFCEGILRLSYLLQVCWHQQVAKNVPTVDCDPVMLEIGLGCNYFHFLFSFKPIGFLYLK